MRYRERATQVRVLGLPPRYFDAPEAPAAPVLADLRQRYVTSVMGLDSQIYFAWQSAFIGQLINVISVYDSTYDPLARPDPTLTLTNGRMVALQGVSRILAPFTMQASAAYSCLYAFDFDRTP